VLLDIYRTKKQKSPVPDRIKATFPLALFLSLLSFTVVRIDAEHFIPIWIFLLLTLFVYFDVKNTGKISMFLIYAVIAGLLILPLAKKYQLVKKVNDKENYTKIQGIQRAERFIISKKWYADLQPAVKKIQELTDKNEKIFVCNERNDITYINDVMFYFLAERLPGTKYHELHPGVTTTLPVQKEIINDLKRNSVRYIVRVHGLNKLDKSGAVFQQAGKGAIFLDEYIITHCERVARFGMYEIMKIKYSI
jgi:energy-coupling factor transporter transmembrane protein EcfT